MKITGRKKLAIGLMIPKWYGVGKYDACQDITYVYPIPFNLLVRAWEVVRWWVKAGSRVIFFRGLSQRVTTLEDKLHRISDLAHHAVVDGYSPKNSPAEHRFECIAAIADHAFKDKE